MNDTPAGLQRPIRVVIFGGGPTIDPGAAQLAIRLDQHPDIEFVGALCQSSSPTIVGIIRDRFRRRRILAVPLLGVELLEAIGRWLMGPLKELSFRRRWAQFKNRLHYVPDIHAPSTLQWVRDRQPDLGLVYGSPILRPELFEIPLLGTLGIHHGQVPEYRGKKTTFWAIYNGEPAAGVTIQKISAALDRGDVVKQGEVPIMGRGLAKVTQELEALGIELYLQAVLEVRSGRAVFRPQAKGSGKLYRDPNLQQLLIFWWRRARALIRTGGRTGSTKPNNDVTANPGGHSRI